MSGELGDELASLATKFSQSSCRASGRFGSDRDRQRRGKKKAGNKIERSINCDGKGERHRDRRDRSRPITEEGESEGDMCALRAPSVHLSPIWERQFCDKTSKGAYARTEEGQRGD